MAPEDTSGRCDPRATTPAMGSGEVACLVSLPDAPPMKPSVRAAVLLRSLAIQGSWNYELLVGNGVGFCLDPALRQLPGGVEGTAYKEALGRESRYFNSHPYLAGLALGALARAELEQVDPAKIERFRTALCGPLGSVGDRLVWTAWLPACSLAGILFFGFGWSPLWVVVGFLVLYNTGHFWLRDWALRSGWRYGMKVAAALSHPVLQHGPRYIGRISAVLGGLALPLAVHRAIGGQPPLTPIPMGVALMTPVLALVLVRVQARAEGWRVVLWLLAAFVLYSVFIDG